MLKVRRDWMGGFVVDHLQGFMVILYANMPTVEVCVELPKAEAC